MKKRDIDSGLDINSGSDIGSGHRTDSDMVKKISMFIDEELPVNEVSHIIKHLQQNNELRKYWEKCNLISGVLKNELPENIEHNIADRVQQAIKAEPPLIAKNSATSNVYYFFQRNMAVAAVAAIVAVSVIIIQKQFIDVSPSSQLQAGLNLSSPTSLATPAAVASNNSAGRQTDNQYIVDSDMYDYLINHAEYSTSVAPRGGMLPYIYGAEKSSVQYDYR